MLGFCSRFEKQKVLNFSEIFLMERYKDETYLYHAWSSTASGHQQLLMISNEHIFLRDSTLQKIWKVNLRDVTKIETHKSDLCFFIRDSDKQTRLTIVDPKKLEEISADVTAVLTSLKRTTV